MVRLAFLLGAGASFPFGIPMMREFYDKFVQYIQRSRAHCMPLIEKLAGTASASPDLELLIERLEQVRSIRSGLQVLARAPDEMLGDLALADELRGYLEMFLIETCEKFDQAKVASKLSKLTVLANARSAYVFTTNYDRLIEVAAASVGLPCCDGFEPASSRPESKWSGEFKSGIKLIKLHGSVNWYEEEGSDALVRLERGYSLPSHDYRLTHGARALRPLMIIPTLEKAILKRPYIGLLTQFSDALKEIDVLVVIGNSLRDEHLRNTIIERASRLEVILVNPAAEDQRDIIAHKESTHCLPITIEAFIEIGLEPLDRMLSALEGTDKAAMRNAAAAFAADITALARRDAGMSADERRQLETFKTGSVDAILEALRSLSQPPHPELLEEMRNLALQPNDESVRVAAIDALLDARGSDAAELFETVACAPGPLPVRAEAILALQSLASAIALNALRRAEVVVSKDPAMKSLVSFGAAGVHG